MIRQLAAVACVLTVLLAGCAFRLADLSIVSTKNVALEVTPIKQSVEGTNCLYFLLGFIPIMGFIPNVEEAMDRALEQVPEGNVLTDIAVYNDYVYFVLASQSCVRVRGDVGKLE